MEVLYEAFPEIDKDIDNRAYGFPNGEASCGSIDPFTRGKEFQVIVIFNPAIISLFPIAVSGARVGGSSQEAISLLGSSRT